MNARHRTTGLVAAIAAAITLAAPSAAVGAQPNVARAATAAEEVGWLRLGHFSPDTAEVDVRLTALSGGTVVFELSDVGYGDLSPYQSLGEGTYTVNMNPAGSDDWSTVAISDTVTVRPSAASTVAAYGPTATLQLQAFDDDLTAPSAGNARIRLIQLSTVTPTVDVATSTGVSIAEDALAGSATAYTEVPAGSWTMTLTGEGVTGSATVDLESGSVYTLFVLDTADGGLTILPIHDSAAAAVVPIGGVDTGGGWLSGTQVAVRHPAPAPRGWAAF